MRVLVVTNMYPPQHLGGYELSCQDVVTRWVAAGHEALVLTSDLVLDGGRRDDPGVAVRRELEWYWHEHEFRRPSPLGRLALERRNQRRLHEALRDVRPDVVSIWHLGGLSTALVPAVAGSGVPIVYVICDEWPLYAFDVDAWMSAWRRRPRSARLARALTRVPTWVPPLPDTGTLTFVSDYIRRTIADGTGWLLDDAPVVPSGIDTAEFTIGAPARAEWAGRLLCVGRVEPRKGFDVAVRALADLPDTSLEIVGPAQPAHREELLRLAVQAGAGDRLTFTELPRPALAERYAAADAVVFPSTWNEPFGLVPLEAMACGTPVIATGTGGSAEFLADRDNCLLVPPGDTEAVVTAVRQLAADPGLREQLVAGGKRTAARFTVDRYAADLAAIHLGASA